MTTEIRIYSSHLSDGLVRLPELMVAQYKAQTLVMSLSLLSTCLFIFTLNDWEAIAKNLMQMKRKGIGYWHFLRMLGSVFEVEFREDGQIRIPQGLAAAAKLTDDVIIVSYPNRFEFWSPIIYEQRDDN